MNRGVNVISLEDRRRQIENVLVAQGLSRAFQPSGATQSHVDEHYHNRLLEQKVASLEREIKEIKEMLQQSSSSFADDFSDEIIELKEISYDEAKEEIAEYFRKNDENEIGYEELIEELRIDPKLVVRACAELLAEGKIG
jgi:DNA mismatch repair ATPase MutS